MSRYETRSSQFGLLSGIRQPHSDMVLVAKPTALFAPEARKGQLYIVAEAEGDLARGRDACQLVLRTIRKVFYEDSSYSVTAALSKAIIAANRALYEHNFSAAALKRAVVGVTCVVIKDNDLYVAQILPAQVYLLAEGKLRALPTHLSWSPAQVGATAFIKPNAIGTSLTIEPDFYRAVLRPGDAVLLCSSNLARVLGQDEVMRLARLPDPSDALDALATICQQNALPEAHGLALTIAPPLSPAAQAAPLSRAGVFERGRMALRAGSAWTARMTGEAALLLRGPGARARQRKAEVRREQTQREHEQLTQMPEEPAHPAETAPRPRPLNMGDPLEERAAQERESRRMRLGMPPPRPPEQTGTPPSSLLGEGGYTTPTVHQRRIDLSDTPGMAALGRSTHTSSSQQSRPSVKSPYDMSLGERLAQPFVRASAALSGRSHRKLLRRPPPSAMPQARRQPGLSYRRQRPPPPVKYLLLITLVLLVALLVVYGKSLADQNTLRAADDSLVRAEQAMAAVRAAPDTASADLLLRAAEDALAEVRASAVVTATQENRLRYDQIEQEYERALASIQKLTYFSDLEEIARHPVAGGQFSSVVVPPPLQSITDTGDFSSIYVLDSNIGMLYRMPKTGGALEAYLRPDDTISGVNVGMVKAQAWRFDNIIAIAQSGEGGPFTFYFPNNGQWSFSNLAGSSEWGRVSQRFRAVNYDGNLYIWGASPNQVLKYTSGNYGDFPVPWIQDDGGHKVEAAVDMAVDGKIYLLQTDGRVLVFSAGAFERELVPQGIDPPLVTPASFFVTLNDPEQGSIFLVDTNNGRIIQIDKQTGAFIQQVRARPDGPIHLDQLTGIYVDENSGRLALYLVNGSQILRASLPDPPRPFREGSTPGPTSAPASTAIPTAAP